MFYLFFDFDSLSEEVISCKVVIVMRFSFYFFCYLFFGKNKCFDKASNIERSIQRF